MAEGLQRIQATVQKPSYLHASAPHGTMSLHERGRPITRDATRSEGTTRSGTAHVQSWVRIGQRGGPVRHGTHCSLKHRT